MTIYYLIYSIFGLTPIITSSLKVREQTAKKSFCFIAFACLVLMLALRHQSMGVDLRYYTYYGYLGRFDAIANAPWNTVFGVKVANYEKGYIFFNKLVSTIYNDRQFFLAACAFFTILPIVYVIYKKSVSPLQSIVIYMGLPVFLLGFSGLRQSLAIGICFFALLYIEDKKFIKFVALVLLAVTFHKSAIIFLIAYPLYRLKMDKARRWLTVILIPIIFIFKRPLFAIFSKIFKENAVADETGAGTLFVIFTLIYIFCIIYSDGSDEQNGFLNLFFIACACQAFGGIYNTAIRVGYYFMLSLVILLPKVLKGMQKDIDKPLFSATVFFAFTTFGLYSIYISGDSWALAYPYYFYWERVVL